MDFGAAFFTFPFGGEVGARRRVRGPSSRILSRKAPLTLALSPKGRGDQTAFAARSSYAHRTAPSPLREEGWGEGLSLFALNPR
ncbi:hypothetical protein ABIB57_001808 [Devosia sp. UYZn731]